MFFQEVDKLTGYIKELRALVGKRSIMQCGASVIVFNESNQVLMIHRTDNNCWGFPGGSIELGEKVEVAAIREVEEETGLKVSDIELFGVFSGEELYYKYPNGDEVYNIDIVYCTKTFIGEMQMSSDETRGCCFFDINKLPEHISPPIIPVVLELKKRFI